MLEITAQVGMWFSGLMMFVGFIVALSGGPYMHLIQFSLVIILISMALWGLYVFIDMMQNKLHER